MICNREKSTQFYAFCCQSEDMHNIISISIHSKNVGFSPSKSLECSLTECGSDFITKFFFFLVDFGSSFILEIVSIGCS